MSSVPPPPGMKRKVGIGVAETVTGAVRGESESGGQVGVSEEGVRELALPVVMEGVAEQLRAAKARLLRMAHQPLT